MVAFSIETNELLLKCNWDQKMNAQKMNKENDITVIVQYS